MPRRGEGETGRGGVTGDLRLMRRGAFASELKAELGRRPGLNKRTTKKEVVPRARLAIKVQPGASRNAVVGKVGEEWKLSVTAPAVEGRANRACIDLLAGRLRVPRSAVRIQRGESSRRKVLEIAGLSITQIEQRLAEEKVG